MGWTTGFDSWQWQRFFLSDTVSRLAVRHAQPPIQGVKLTTHPHFFLYIVSRLPFSAEVKNVQGYTSNPSYIMVWCLVTDEKII
jgi:hypothetical protein